jgi:arginase
MPVETGFTLIGAATSAGAHHAGQERAPSALRSVGFVRRLREAGFEVEDRGDVVSETFAVDHDCPTARNIDATVRAARAVADAVASAESSRPVVVIGGDCTVTLGVLAGLQRREPDVGLVYFDGDADLGTPERGGSGILDSMGVAHLLGMADTPLARLSGTSPAISLDRFAMLGYNTVDPDMPLEEGFRRFPRLVRYSDGELRSNPREAASAALEHVSANSTGVIVHFDVDVVDSGDLPLGNFPHYGTGLRLSVAAEVLAVLLASPKLRAFVLTEVNPSYDPDGQQLERYVEAVTGSLIAGVSTVGVASGRAPSAAS